MDFMGLGRFVFTLALPWVLITCTTVAAFDPQFGGECNITTVRVGCYRDRVLPTRPIPQLLFTDRDPTSPHYSGGYIDLKNWNMYLKDLKCRCAEAAKERGFTLFGLQWYGECRGSPNSTQSLYARDGPSKECVTHDLAECTVYDKDCVGRDYTNFVYYIPGPKKDAIPEIWTPPPTSPTSKPTTQPTSPTPKPTTPPPPSPSPSRPRTPLVIQGTVTECRPECFPPNVCPTVVPCRPLYVINKRRLDNTVHVQPRFQDQLLREPSLYASKLWSRILKRFSYRRGSSPNKPVRYLLNNELNVSGQQREE